jgi:hypothetical protein
MALKAKLKKSANTIPTEDHEQAHLATWLTKQGIRFFAIPNGGSRHLLEALKLKRCGVQRGVPDICVPIPSGSYHGLFIELKRVSGSKVSDEQAEWINYLNKMGYYAKIAYGFIEAKAIVEYYLALTPHAA